MLNLPPLRYRKEDIAELAEHFALRMCLELGYDYFSGFTVHALQQLMAHDWPGNVRELKNVVERSIYRHADPAKPVADIVLDPFASPWRTSSAMISPSVIPVSAEPNIPPALQTTDLKTELARLEQSLILQALQQQHFHQRRTAQSLGLSYDQLRAALRKYPHLLTKRSSNEG